MSRSTSAPAVRAPSAGAAGNPSSDVHVQLNGDDILITCDTRSYRVRGLERNATLQQLRVNLLATRDSLVHLDTLDLYQARSRASFIRAAAAELYVDEPLIKRDLGRLLLELERIQHERLEAARQAQPTRVELTEREREEALELLRDVRLVDRIGEDFEHCGLVGEATNRLLVYLACVSRRLAQPLAVLVQSGSAAGKTTLMDHVLAMMPPEDQVRYSALTGQSLYYMGRMNLRHKILAVAEEQGVAEAAYALKLLQSDGRLRIAATGKNSGSGRQETETYEVEGPVMMLLTTTAEAPDDELANRCLTLEVNESAEQTAAIHARQRAAYTLAGQAADAERDQMRQLHQNAQRLIQPLPVVMPWAERLRYRTDQTRMRRDHAKYLSLIAASALLHQHQRPRRTRDVDGQSIEYVEATIDDVALAGRLLGQVMGRSLDALLPQTRQLLTLIDRYVAERAQRENKPRSLVRWTQRELREWLAWGDFQLRRHLARLVELEYVLAYRTGQGNQRQYQLLYDGEDASSGLTMRLVDPSELTATAPSPAGFDHSPDRNDAHSMPIRSAFDAPSSGSENGVTGRGNGKLRRSARKPARKPVKR